MRKGSGLGRISVGQSGFESISFVFLRKAFLKLFFNYMIFKIMRKSVGLCVLFLLAIHVFGQETVRVSHPWADRKVAYFGDSITDPNNNGSKCKYWGFLQEWLGITPFVYGVSGRTWADIPNQADKLEADHGSDFDAIVVFVGTNDYNHGVPIGEWYRVAADSVLAANKKVKRAKYLRSKRTLAMDKGTYRGRINIAMMKMKTMFPDKQIVLLTPIHRSYFEAGLNNVQPSEEYQNSCGEFFDRYVESVKEAGEVWGVPVINMYSLSGLAPTIDVNAALYFHDTKTDRLHPNDAGHARMARTLACQLVALPCVF